MKKLLKIFVITFVFTVSNNSFADQFDRMRGGFTEKSDCPILYNLGRWEHKYITGGGEYWAKRQAWIQGSWESDVWIGIDLDEKSKSYSIINDSHNSSSLIYIGPWQEVILTYPARFGEEKKQIEVEIRLIATQKGSMIRSHYETKDDLNKDIPEQRFILLEPSDDLIELCKVKWVSRFGYNAVADYKLNPFRFFTGNVLTGSGKIIDSETGKIIADEKGNLIKP